MADRYLCRVCSKVVTATQNKRYRTHDAESGERCDNASVEIPEDLLAAGPETDKKDDGTPKEGRDFNRCPSCSKNVKMTRLGYFENHTTTLYGGERCPNSGVRFRPLKKVEDVPLPGDDAPKPGATAPAKNDAYWKSTVTDGATAPQPVMETAVSRPDIPASSTTAMEPVEAAPDALVDLLKEELGATVVATFPSGVFTPEAAFEAEVDRARRDYSLIPDRAPNAESGAFTEDSSPVSGTTSEPSPEPERGPLPPEQFSLGTVFSQLFLQPFSPFLQPPEIPPERPVFIQPVEYDGPPKPEPMGDLAKELATKIKETFYAYSNRKTQDNRSAQTTLGPSEIGTPCDRRLAMELLGVPPVNPGGDGWAAFVGTCTHVGMAEVYTFADAGTGRYSVELPVFLGTSVVPRGTTDLLDRRDATVIDWKIMGAYSLKKFKAEGPSITYRTQAHTYGLGAERGGERVKNVAIVGLPRAGSSLDEMHVWTEKYDRKFAEAALARVERIANQIQEIRRVDGLGDTPSPMATAQAFDAADDCRYCPFHLKNDKEMTRGCPGK